MVCVLASSKMWHPELAENLQVRTSKKFLTVTSPAQLTEDFLIEVQPDYVFFPHWSSIIPAKIFNQFECVVFHMTDLPFGRGGSPLQNLIVNGMNETQLTALRCEAGIDTGPIYLKKPLSLQGRAQDIYYQASRLIEDMIVDIIQKKMKPVPQQGEVVNFARRKPEDSNIATLSELNKIYDYIRMLDAEGYPKAFFETENARFEFSHAVLQGDEILANVSIKLKRKDHDTSSGGNSSSS